MAETGERGEERRPGSEGGRKITFTGFAEEDWGSLCRCVVVYLTVTGGRHRYL